MKKWLLRFGLLLLPLVIVLVAGNILASVHTFYAIPIRIILAAFTLAYLYGVPSLFMIRANYRSIPNKPKTKAKSSKTTKSKAAKAKRREELTPCIITALLLLFVWLFCGVQTTRATRDILSGPTESVFQYRYMKLRKIHGSGRSIDKYVLVYQPSKKEKLKLRISDEETFEAYKDIIGDVLWEDSIYSQFKVTYWPHLKIVTGFEGAEPLGPDAFPFLQP